MKCSKCQQPAEYLLFAYRETFNSRRRLLIPDPYACGAHVDEVAKEIRDSFTGFTRVHAERLDAGLSDVPVIPTLDRAVGSNPALDAAS